VLYSTRVSASSSSRTVLTRRRQPFNSRRQFETVQNAACSSLVMMAQPRRLSWGGRRGGGATVQHHGSSSAGGARSHELQQRGGPYKAGLQHPTCVHSAHPRVLPCHTSTRRTQQEQPFHYRLGRTPGRSPRWPPRAQKHRLEVIKMHHQ
jgi:hypothetical protein